MSRYFKSDAPDFAPLLQAQEKILERHLEKRQRERDRKFRARMKGLPALPRDLGDWLRREVLPAYFLYGHAKGSETTGVCTACGHEASLTGVKHNATGLCLRCGREFTMKPRGRIGQLQDRVTCQVVQKVRHDELVIRIIKVIAGIPEINIWENARQFISVGPDSRVQCGSQQCRSSLERCIGSGAARLCYRWQNGRTPETRFRQTAPGKIKVSGLLAETA